MYKRQARASGISLLESGKKKLVAQEDTVKKDTVKKVTAYEKLLKDGGADGMRKVASFADPIGKPVGGMMHPNGMRITKMTVPLGVIGIICEARPNVTADAAALCLKSGNAVILRGGKEAIRSNEVIANVMRNALEQSGLPADCVQLVQDTSRPVSYTHLDVYKRQVQCPRRKRSGCHH